jgi:hypothetical protein
MTNDEAVNLAVMTANIWADTDCIGHMSSHELATQLIRLRRLAATGRALEVKICNEPVDENEVEGKRAQYRLRAQKIAKKLQIDIKIQHDPRGAYLQLSVPATGVEFRI